MAEFGIDVIVDPSKAVPGLDKVDRRLKRTEKSAKRLGGTLKRALTLVGLIAVARQVGTFADSLTNVQNRLRLVTKDTAQLNAVTKRLFDISARTRTGFSATATIFSRTALAVKDLGLSLNETLGFTEALNQAIVLSGVKAQEANAGLIQLSQGLASGTLRGDELRSVLEQLPKVADLIADELEVARGELRLLGEQGLISTKQIINAFTGIAAADLTKAFADSIPTISQGFSVLESRIIQFIGKADEANKFSEKLARGLIFVAENLDTVAKVAIVAGAALVGPFAKAGVLFATRAVLALNAAILLNPIGALVILAIAAVVAIDQFGDSIAVSADGLTSLKDVAIATWNAIVEGLAPLLFLLKLGFKDALNFVIDSFGTLNLTFTDVLTFVKTFVGKMLSFFFGLNRAIASIFKDLKAIFKDVFGRDTEKLVDGATEHILDAFETIKNIVGFSLHGLGLIATELGLIIDDIDPKDKSFTGTFLTVGKNAHDAFVKGFGTDIIGAITDSVAPALKKIEADAKKISLARRSKVKTQEGDQGLDDKALGNVALPFAVRNLVTQLGRESEALQLSNRERDIQNTLLEKEAKLRAAGVTVTPVITEIVTKMIEFNTVIAEQGDLLEDLNGPQVDLAQRQKTLNALLTVGKISLERYNEETRKTKLAMEDAVAATKPYSEELEAINGPIKELTRRLEALNALYALGEVSLKRVTDATRELSLAQLEFNIADGGGFTEKFEGSLDDTTAKIKSFVDGSARVLGNFFDFVTLGFTDGFTDTFNSGLERATEGIKSFVDKGTDLLAGFFDFITLGLVGDGLEALAEGGFFDAFSIGIEGMLDKALNVSVEMGFAFADFFSGLSEGFSGAIGNAIVFGEDLSDAIGGAARQALAGLLSGLINIGIQFVLNSLLSDTLKQKEVAGAAAGATADATARAVKTTAALASISLITAALVSSNAAIALSAAAPAALVSLATAGANSIPASAGILATAGVAEGVAATTFLADGGLVTGPGGPRSDSVPAMLSNGEFVVNAKSTARFRAQLEMINEGEGGDFADGGLVSARAPERTRPQLEAIGRAVSDEAITNQATRDDSQSSSANPDAPTPTVNVLNVLDPSIVEDFVDSPNGEKVILNLIERNAGSINAVLGA